MKLTFEQIKAITCGAVRFTENNGALRPERFFESQLAKREDGTTVYRGERMASIYFDFSTDADSVTLRYTNSHMVNDTPYMFFDLYIDGTLTEHIGGGEFIDTKQYNLHYIKDGTVTFDLKKSGEKRVLIYLPSLCHIEIAEITLNGGTFIKPQKRPNGILAFGDSITEGHSSRYPSLHYIDILGRAFDAIVYNFGIGGETFRSNKIEDFEYPYCDFVTVAYGTNDFNSLSKEGFMFSMPAFFEKLYTRFGKKPVFVILPVWRGDRPEDTARKIGTLQDVRIKIAKEAGRYPNITVIDAQNFIPHCPDFYEEDVLHPNTLGHLLYGQNIEREIKKYIKL